MSESTPVPFADLQLDPALLMAIEALGFENATPIQAAAVPVMLEGHDIIGRARTGSGKTAAFGLPLLHRVRAGGSPPRALVMAPTRELALQVTEALRSFSNKLPLRIATVYGGAPYPQQIRALRTATVVVGTPGRLLDHLQRGNLKLGSIEVFVLDEADEMLRMGFIDDVSTLLAATPDSRQVALFSATMPPEIRRIADKHLNDPQEVQVEGRAMTVDHIEQEWMRVPSRNKIEALQRVLQGRAHEAVLVFSRTRAGCAEIADALTRRGVAVDALHGDLSQPARERVLNRLRSKNIEVVIATDVAARGLDVDHITHVINLDLPMDTETYVHRIGRTGRVGRKGTAITFATPKEKQRIRRIARALRVDIEQTEVPSDAHIAKRHQEALSARLAGALDAEDDAASAWLDAFLSEHSKSALDVALAAIRLLAEDAETSLKAVEEESRPSWSRPACRESNVPYAPLPNEPENEVQLFIPIGRRSQVRPQDIVGALANEAGIDGRRIGKVIILDHKTFVGVSRAAATEILDGLDRIQIRGQEVLVTLARPGSEMDFSRSRRPRFRKR